MDKEYHEFYTDEMMEEYKKALVWADKYKMNSDRIKRLLSFDPVTMDNGRILVSNNKTPNGCTIILIDGWLSKHYTGEYGIVNPILL